LQWSNAEETISANFLHNLTPTPRLETIWLKSVLDSTPLGPSRLRQR
jgi:hypothetical protein